VALSSLFAPLQGLFNFLIFIRPRYGAVRREFPQSSRFWSLYHAVWHPVLIQRQKARVRKLVHDCQLVGPSVALPSPTISIENVPDRMGEASSGKWLEVAAQSGFETDQKCDILDENDASSTDLAAG
jgi:hypothetical protein